MKYFPPSSLPSYEHPTEAPCFKRLSKAALGTPMGTEKIHVAFPYGVRLAGNEGYFLALQMIAGKVSYIRFSTRGRYWQSEDLATFTAKFGDPRNIEPLHLQNGFGARYEAIKATWMLPNGIKATYASWATESSGEFDIGTSEGERLFWEKSPAQPVTAL